METAKIKELVSRMTLEEKASLCSGLDFWHTKGVERLGIPSEMVSDGPHGLRKQDDKADHLGINDSIQAVCFPAGCATASSFNRELVTKLGETLGEECQAENVSAILGPAMNIKRSPLCGRNFEYYSEDPLVSTEMAGALVHGVQSKHIGTSPKHFMANNQEYHRLTSSSEMDERTMREIYLASFEGMVKKEKPWTIMNAYNKLNGTYLCENKEMLTDVLRREWGFDGYVMTDWGAMNDRVEALKAGCNLEMPWLGKVKAVLEAYLGGQAVGGAVVNVLYGNANPSGRLAETFPLRIQDTPCYLNYGGEHDKSVYSEGVFVGYRYYTSKEMEVLFPFGYGLSYTTFSYGNLTVDKKEFKESEKLLVSVDVTNTGACTGKEVVQLYVAPKGGTIIRPVRELKAFEKTELAPGETKTVTFELDSRAYAYWNTEIHDWHVETGAYEIQICRNAQEVLLSEEVQVESETVLPKVYTLNSTMGEIMADPKGKAILEQAMSEMEGMDGESTEEQMQDDSGVINDEMMAAMMEAMPLRQMLSFVPGVTKEALNQLVAALNAAE